MRSKVYLGDSVYVEVDHGMLVLTTENGYGPTNTIALEPETYHALQEYVAALMAAPPKDAPQDAPSVEPVPESDIPF